MVGVQKTFLDFVEETTDKLETVLHLMNTNESKIGIQDKPEEPQQPLEFKPKQDMSMTIEVTANITKIWDTVRHRADFERFLDIVLAALERRESDYMSLIDGIDRKELEAYAQIFALLSNYFLDGYYGDPLGTFYEQNFSHGRNGEFYTPWNIAYFMAKIMNPTPDEKLIDPTCGSGRMLLAARCVVHESYGWITSSRYGRNLYGTDISSRAVKITKINLYLTDYVYMICLMEDVVFEIMKKKEGEINGESKEHLHNVWKSATE